MIKRIFDLVLSIMGLLIFLPLFIYICLAIYLIDGRPIFFLQNRIGKGGKVFKIIKFRSMRRASSPYEDVDLLENDTRVTSIGRILRATAMDELPQLINILRGEMSFVGPKPLPYLIEDEESKRYKYLDQVPGYQARSSVVPGLTGLAQIYAPKNSSRKEKFKFDYDYVKTQSIFLDIKLIFISFYITLKGRWESGYKKI